MARDNPPESGEVTDVPVPHDVFDPLFLSGCCFSLRYCFGFPFFFYHPLLQLQQLGVQDAARQQASALRPSAKRLTTHERFCHKLATSARPAVQSHTCTA